MDVLISHSLVDYVRFIHLNIKPKTLSRLSYYTSLSVAFSFKIGLMGVNILKYSHWNMRKRFSVDLITSLLICCVTEFSWGYSPQIGSLQQTTVQILPTSSWWPREFYWDYLQECGWWVIYGSRSDSNTTITKPNPSTGDRSQKLETCPALSRWLCWSEPLTGSAAVLCSFYVSDSQLS